MGQIGANQDDVAGAKAFDVIAYELRAATLMEIDEFDLGVIMPAIVDIRIPVFPDAEGVGWCTGNLQ
jgi:hypothetical protein